jgi:integrase
VAPAGAAGGGSSASTIGPRRSPRPRSLPVPTATAPRRNGYRIEAGIYKPQSKRNALRAWSAALDKIGVDANLHSLRHTFISAHAERDTPVVLVSDLVGHSRVTTTQTHYIRVRGGERQRLESLREVL